MALSKFANDIFDNLLNGYRIVMVYDADTQPEDYRWLAYVQEWEGCLSDGRTPEEAMERIAGFAQSWYYACIDNNIPVPPPIALEDFHAWGWDKKKYAKK